MTLQELYRDTEEFPNLLRDLADVSSMVDGWLLHRAPIDPDLARYAAFLLSSIAERADDPS